MSIEWNALSTQGAPYIFYRAVRSAVPTRRRVEQVFSFANFTSWVRRPPAYASHSAMRAVAAERARPLSWEESQRDCPVCKAALAVPGLLPLKHQPGTKMRLCTLCTLRWTDRSDIVA